MDMGRLIFILLIIAGIWKFYSYSGEVTLGSGVMVKEPPYQEVLSLPVMHNMDDYTVKSLLGFRLKAKVLSKKNYYIGRESELSTTDLALGWGRMSDESVLEKIKISQSGRYYRWRVDGFPIPRKEIETHSANMHLIPANASSERNIARVRKGDIIQLSGSLVEVTSNTDDWRWVSSQTRNDVGKGACELILVDSLYIVTP